ncbi:T9SS-dependent M36 family metallopeptidase [Hymenobacter arizonensis]|nr:T9SS-dependent M36 family metallopeptidase [Hymenobacter arizonensis]
MRKQLPRVARLMLTAALISSGNAAFSQGSPAAKNAAVPRAALEHLKGKKQALQLSDEDIADLVLSSESSSKKSGLRHLYLQQRYQGIEIHNAVTNMSLTKNDEVVQVGNRFEKQAGKKVKAKGSKMSAQAAVAAAAKHLNLSPKALTVEKRAEGTGDATVFSKGGISLEPITSKLVYQPMADGSLRLAYEVSIYELDAQNWWNIRVDAATGEFLEKDNLVTHCQFDNNGPGGVAMHDGHAHAAKAEVKAFDFSRVIASITGANSYSVFDSPLESPSHGERSVVETSKADAKASPRGWHYTPFGDETRTRGNNVFAYEDPNNNNNFNLNYSPDGGADLNFNFPLDLTKQPVVNRDAATANLFYWSNIIHDVWYQYGFDEISGNFQYDNFEKGGAQSDPVLAESQDSRNIPTTRNNANFATPADGGAPRMQMYLWSSPADPDMFRVTAPATIAGTYPSTQAGWGKQLTSASLTGTLVIAQGTGANPQEGCGTFANIAEIEGKIAVVYRGTCPFTEKAEAAQKAGATAVVIINNAPGAPIALGGVPTVPVTIPVVMVSDVTGLAIRNQMNAGQEVTIALKDDGKPELDGDFDNGIIAHEYGHGVSNRLTGGRLQAACLNNAEQMGEGWSDWLGLVMTMKPGDTGAKKRGIGTYVQGQSTDGNGIRPAPYSTDFGINSFTYAATNNPAITQPHGIGFVWSTMLWDMTWSLIDKYGFKADLYNGTGGNNLAMQLVIDGMKLQPCRPGFVDGRDAILLADRQNNGGANQELIWRAFAKRGLGFSAKQGLSTNRSDQEEAFDLPPVYACSAPTITVSPATAGFPGAAAKTIYLGYGAQTVTLTASNISADPAFTSFTWTPAAGLSNATIANPVFTPTKAGTFTFTVTVKNNNECTRTANVTIEVVDVKCGPANAKKVEVCFKGKPMCVDVTEAGQLLADGRATIGKCTTPQAKAIESALVVADGGTNELQLMASPNPTASNTNLSFTLTKAGSYRLEVLNMQGALVSVVAEGTGDAGERRDYSFSKGRLATGMYVVRLVTGSQSQFARIMLMD